MVDPPRARVAGLAAFSASVLVGLLSTLAPASAATLTVSNTNDSFAGSLRQQVLDSAAGDTIVFAPNVWGQNINLTSGEIAVGHRLTILGPQHDLVEIRGTASSRLFSHTAGHVTLAGLALADAFVDGGGFPGGLILANTLGDTLTITDCYLADGHAAAGGLLYAANTGLELTRCTFNAGVAPGGSGFGGALACNGTITVTDCLFFGNQSNNCGGAIYSNGPATFTRCTFTQNVGATGGALCTGTGHEVLTDCTIAGNTGGGVYSGESIGLGLRNCIVANNGGADLTGAFQTLGYNMIGDVGTATGVGTPGSHDQAGTSGNPLAPNLGPLQDNGGPTWTMAPAAGSLAIDQGQASGGAPTDARGHARTYDNPGVINANGGDGTDVGALEVGPATSFQVTNLKDDGPGSLRRATVTAAAGDTITFRSDLAGTIRLTSGELFPKRGFHIQGPGPNVITVDGNGVRPALDTYPGEAGLTVSGLRFTHGLAPACVWVRSGTSLGLDLAEVSDNACAGIQNNGTLTLSRSLVARNNAASGQTQGATSGGGLYSDHNAMLTNCTFAADTSYDGGAIFNQASGNLVLVSCTVAGNVAKDFTPGSSVCGGVYDNGSSCVLTSTIVAGNTASDSPDVHGAFGTGGYNLVGKGDGSALMNGLNHDQVGSIATPIAAMLGPLADNGGPTLTLMPLAGSPAIDQGIATGLTTDQRLRARVFDDGAVANAGGGDASDVGACERGAGTVDVAPGPPAAGATLAADRIDAVLPDPFVDRCTVRFTLARASAARLALYDVAGRRVATLLDAAALDAGPHAVAWGTGDEAVAGAAGGRPLAAGVYWLRLSAPGAPAVTRSVVRLR